MDDDQVLICRCEEVTVGDVLRAVADGARTVTGVKRRTRAGMGSCQGRSCEVAIARVIADELDLRLEDILPAAIRPPLVPVPFGALAGSGSDDHGRG